MFTYKKGSADFGSTDQGSYKSEEEEKKPKEGSSEGKADNILSDVKPMLGAVDTLCGCANKDKQAEGNKKNELQELYPTRDCGPNPSAVCTAYNLEQLRKRDAAFNDWKASKDMDTGAEMAPSDVDKIRMVNGLAKGLKAKRPDVGNMTLAQVYAKYPNDFEQIYAQIQQKYPMFKNIPAAMALAMSPALSGMTVDQLITQTDNILKGASSSGSKSGASAMGVTGGLGIAAVAGVALFALSKMFKR